MKIDFLLSEIDTVARQILNENPQKIIIFRGAMGAGKTTLIKSICKALEVKNTISSPTFSLINEYQTIENDVIYHFDFYRLKTETEALDFGVDDYLYSNKRCFLEWAENIPNLLPKEHSVITIEALENEIRSLKLSV
jgi:tRNA threonylcarbamoyladenosine biosynthesis protein TsaE